MPTFADTFEKTGLTSTHTKGLRRDSEITTPFRIRAAHPVPHARRCLGAIQAHHLIGIDRPVAWLLAVAQARLKDKTERAGCRQDLTKIKAQTALALYYDGMEDRFFVFTSQGNPAPSLTHGDATIVDFITGGRGVRVVPEKSF
jgi:hypothetical protein